MATTVELVQKWADVHHPDRGRVIDVDIESGFEYCDTCGPEPAYVEVLFAVGRSLEIQDFQAWLAEVFAANGVV